MIFVYVRPDYTGDEVGFAEHPSLTEGQEVFDLLQAKGGPRLLAVTLAVEVLSESHQVRPLVSVVADELTARAFRLFDRLPLELLREAVEDRVRRYELAAAGSASVDATVYRAEAEALREMLACRETDTVPDVPPEDGPTPFVIQCVPGGYSISDGAPLLPGHYETLEAARVAFCLPVPHLELIRDIVNRAQQRPIKRTDLPHDLTGPARVEVRGTCRYQTVTWGSGPPPIADWMTGSDATTQEVK